MDRVVTTLGSDPAKDARHSKPNQERPPRGTVKHLARVDSKSASRLNNGPQRGVGKLCLRRSPPESSAPCRDGGAGIVAPFLALGVAGPGPGTLRQRRHQHALPPRAAWSASRATGIETGIATGADHAHRHALWSSALRDSLASEAKLAAQSRSKDRQRLQSLRTTTERTRVGRSAIKEVSELDVRRKAMVQAELVTGRREERRVALQERRQWLREPAAQSSYLRRDDESQMHGGHQAEKDAQASWIVPDTRPLWPHGEGTSKCPSTTTPRRKRARLKGGAHMQAGSPQGDVLADDSESVIENSFYDTGAAFGDEVPQFALCGQRPGHVDMDDALSHSCAKGQSGSSFRTGNHEVGIDALSPSLPTLRNSSQAGRQIGDAQPNSQRMLTSAPPTTNAGDIRRKETACGIARGEVEQSCHTPPLGAPHHVPRPVCGKVQSQSQSQEEVSMSANEPASGDFALQGTETSTGAQVIKTKILHALDAQSQHVEGESLRNSSFVERGEDVERQQALKDRQMSNSQTFSLPVLDELSASCPPRLQSRCRKPPRQQTAVKEAEAPPTTRLSSVVEEDRIEADARSTPARPALTLTATSRDSNLGHAAAPVAPPPASHPDVESSQTLSERSFWAAPLVARYEQAQSENLCDAPSTGDQSLESRTSAASRSVFDATRTGTTQLPAGALFPFYNFCESQMLESPCGRLPPSKPTGTGLYGLHSPDEMGEDGALLQSSTYSHSRLENGCGDRSRVDGSFVYELAGRSGDQRVPETLRSMIFARMPPTYATVGGETGGFSRRDREEGGATHCGLDAVARALRATNTAPRRRIYPVRWRGAEIRAFFQEQRSFILARGPPSRRQVSGWAERFLMAAESAPNVNARGNSSPRARACDISDLGLSRYSRAGTSARGRNLRSSLQQQQQHDSLFDSFASVPWNDSGVWDDSSLELDGYAAPAAA
ncbi:hypothetical protein CBOM_04679 [Ceraceosorus bombacis]|uniref:Uncharacterized protein n=1 Tax=Ceraceosorus bombacis TaxID=401625 RepID=A0A0N7LB33_9BASI|nr:hypothetical protein CBOM_04679 [Ceraceosorus bombacis]